MPVVLEPFLEILVFELVRLIVLVDVLKHLFHRSVDLLIWVSLQLGNISMRRRAVVGILVTNNKL